MSRFPEKFTHAFRNSVLLSLRPRDAFIRVKWTWAMIGSCSLKTRTRSQSMKAGWWRPLIIALKRTFRAALGRRSGPICILGQNKRKSLRNGESLKLMFLVVRTRLCREGTKCQILTTRKLIGRRAYLRAELDAWYARAYGLSRDELRYILDPAAVRGPDYPSETFRVLKKNEIARFGEYRTARLVLAAWDAQEARPAAAQCSRRSERRPVIAKVARDKPRQTSRYRHEPTPTRRRCDDAVASPTPAGSGLGSRCQASTIKSRERNVLNSRFSALFNAPKVSNSQSSPRISEGSST